MSLSTCLGHPVKVRNSCKSLVIELHVISRLHESCPCVTIILNIDFSEIQMSCAA